VLALGITSLLTGTASAADVDFVCTGSGQQGGLGIVGVPPLDIQCEVLPPPGASYSEATWTVGDGELYAGETISYRYEDFGQYTISVQLEDFEGADESDSGELTRYGFVTVCGPPEPEFTYINKGGLDIKLVNKSAIVAPSCLESSKWSVFQGDTADGIPRFTFDTWEPRFELPAEGSWTIRLTQGGMGGLTHSDLTLEARYKLTDDLTLGPKAQSCNLSHAGQAGTAFSGLGLLLLAPWLVRRRR
jgi:hypothetical protein